MISRITRLIADWLRHGIPRRIAELPNALAFPEIIREHVIAVDGAGRPHDPMSPDGPAIHRSGISQPNQHRSSMPWTRFTSNVRIERFSYSSTAD